MKTLLACLAALPFAAHSEVLFLQYEGTVKSVDPAPWFSWTYKPGDKVTGLTTIDTKLTPPDVDPSDSIADYVATSTGTAPYFLTTLSLVVFGIACPPNCGPFHNDALSRVVVGPNHYFVQDRKTLTLQDGSTDLKELEIGVTRDNLVDGVDVAQQFDAIPAKDGSTLTGRFIRSFHQVSAAVTFALSRVSLTPGGCRP